LKALAGFEKSGHFFFNPPIGLGYDDGIVAGIAVLEMLDRPGARSCRHCNAVVIAQADGRIEEEVAGFLKTRQRFQFGGAALDIGMPGLPVIGLDAGSFNTGSVK